MSDYSSSDYSSTRIRLPIFVSMSTVLLSGLPFNQINERTKGSTQHEVSPDHSLNPSQSVHKNNVITLVEIVKLPVPTISGILQTLRGCVS